MSEFTVPLAEWLLRTLTVGGGVLLLGWLAVRVSRVPATRQRIASAAIHAALLAPVLCALPAWVWIPAPAIVAEQLPPPNVARSEIPTLAVVTPEDGDATAAGVDEPPVSTTALRTTELPPAAVPSATGFDWRGVLLLGYGVIALALFVQLLRGHRVLLKLWRASRPLSGRLAAASEESALEVRVSDRIGSAACFGFGRPRVLLPLTFARAAGPAQLRWVLAHEFDHARRGDHRAAYLVGLCRALYFVAPWFWLLRRDLLLSQEFLADAAAARAEPAEYAAFLVELSAGGPFRPRRAALAATGVGATRSDLFRRVTMILSPNAATGRSARLWGGLVGMAIVTVAVLASGVGLTADEPPAKPKPVDPAGIKPKLLPADPDEAKPVDPQALRKQLAEMIRNGNPDPDELRKLIEEMNAQMAEQMRQRMGRGGFQFQRQGGGFDPFGPAVPAKSPVREQYEKRLKEFDADIAKNADNAGAQAALKKAREAYVEAMADELKKADEEAKKNQPAVPAFPNFPNIQFGGGGGNIEVIPFPAFPGFDNPFGGRGGVARPRLAQSPLGIQVEKPSPALAEQLDLPADAGLVVSAVVAGSPAEKAGVKKSDVVVKVAGKDVPNDPAAFTDLVAKLKAGEKFDVDVIRKGKKETVKGVELPQPRKPALVPGGRLEADRIGFNQMQVQVSNGDVNIQASAGGTSYTIRGSVEDGKVVPTKIVVDDGEKAEYESLEKVPEKHRPAVQQLLGQVRAFGGR